MITVLRDAEPEHKLDVYRNLGLRLTYNPDTRTVRAAPRHPVPPNHASHATTPST